MTTIACLLTCLATMSGVEDTTITPFCRDYNSVLSQAYRGFRKFRGVAPEYLGQTYKAKLSLPGASCTIRESEFTYQYSCSWPQRDIADWQGTVAQARTLATALADCSHVRMHEASNLADDDGSLRWRALLALPSSGRTQVEVKAGNWDVRNARTPRLAHIILNISYRRETGS